MPDDLVALSESSLVPTAATLHELAVIVVSASLGTAVPINVARSTARARRRRRAVIAPAPLKERTNESKQHEPCKHTEKRFADLLYHVEASCLAAVLPAILASRGR